MPGETIWVPHVAVLNHMVRLQGLLAVMAHLKELLVTIDADKGVLLHQEIVSNHIVAFRTTENRKKKREMSSGKRREGGGCSRQTLVVKVEPPGSVHVQIIGEVYSLETL